MLIIKPKFIHVDECILDVGTLFYSGRVSNEGSVSQSQYIQYSQRNSVEKFLHNAQMVRLGEISRLRQVTSLTIKLMTLLFE